MASAKETPRQKMIGMMYLVLTALLALNVSKDILDAFIVVNKGLENTNLNFTDRNDYLYAQFELAKTVDPVRVAPKWKMAQDVKKQSAELFAYIDKLQKQLIAETDGITGSIADTIKMANISSKDNYDTPTNILIGDSEDGSAGASGELKKKLDNYKIQLSTCILPKDKKKVAIDINTEAPANTENNENWEMYNFYHRPLVASLTILTKLKNDVKSAESTVVDYLLKQVDAGRIPFDTVAAKVIPNSNYVLLGEEYKADLFVAAFSKTRNPEISVGDFNEETQTYVGTPSPVLVEKGVGKYNVKTTREGVFTYSGIIKMRSGENQELTFPFKSEYIVAKPMLTVSADSMNAVYLGLENPISVSVPGIPNERLTVSVTNADAAKKNNGTYILKIKSGPKVQVTVFATMENGEKKNMGTKYFRVKRIPKPNSVIGPIKGNGTMSKSSIDNYSIIEAKYDNFDFNAKGIVKSYVMSYYVNGVWGEKRVNGNSLSEVKTLIKSLRKNDRIIFEQIKAVGPDGILVSLEPMTIKLN